MGIIKREQKNGITICHVELDTKDDYFSGKILKPECIKTIIDYDVDVYSAEDNKLLLRFRKNKLPSKNTCAFYDNVIEFASTITSSNRGMASGKIIMKKNKVYGKLIHSNIMGYYDKFTPNQKIQIRSKHLKYRVRECRFNRDHPDKFKNMTPYIQSVNHLYQQYLPDQYDKQKQKANQTCFRIPNTAFTTITTNVNFQTAVHLDKGDDEDGFGNLSVIEHGKYTGGETCFPQYGIGIDVRTGDILFMDVHKYHGNLPIVKKTEDAIRLSIVCYLRTNVWKNTLHSTIKQCNKQNTILRQLSIHKTNKTKKLKN